MGCAISRADDSPILLLCRQRRDLIRAAADSRYALASAHASYFRSLAAVGDALHRFVHEELIPIPSPPPSPVLTIPSDEGKPFRSSTSSITPLSHSLSSDDEQHHTPTHSHTPSYMRASSTAVPSVVYTPFPEYTFDYPVADPPQAEMNDAYYDEMRRRDEIRRREAAGTPPPPPPSGGSAWDIFNPFFDSYEPGYYPGRYGLESAVSSPDLSEVRVKEGIPELEEDTEVEIARDARKGKKVVDGSEEVGTSKAAARRKSDSHEIESSSPEKQSKSSSLGSNKLSSGEEEVGAKRKGVGSGGESSLVTEESGSSSVDASDHRTRDVLEVMDEIKQQFKTAIGFGEEVARMLEVGRMPYRSGCGITTVIYSRILDVMALAPSTASHPSFKRQRLSSASRLKNKFRYADIEKLTAMKSGNLSSTLEKLYVWEKKLYKEVKDEEQLRIMYNKKWRQLKRLDDRGAETHKIDSIRASIRNLSTKISVVIRYINTISSRVHKIRDEELQPQLIELIRGLIKMWNFVLDCHQKQFQALVHSRTDKLMAKTGTQRNSAARATRELETELLRWHACFKDWIDTQRDYIKALNGWLMKWLIQEQEVTSDGVVPFSPSRVGAPASFIISNDWYNAIESVSESEVTRSIQSFAGNLHEMRESQKKEQHHRRRAEYLSVDIAKRIKSLHGDQGTVATTGDPVANNDAAMKALDLLRKRLDEERAKHEEIVKHIQQASSSCLGTGLVPILEALKNFTLKMAKAYEKLRIPNESLE